jgi:decaprenyl-phosphate phosphoribosyltransferase
MSWLPLSWVVLALKFCADHKVRAQREQVTSALPKLEAFPIATKEGGPVEIRLGNFSFVLSCHLKVFQGTLSDMKSSLNVTFRAMRAKQWIKNVLVFVAPFAAGVGISQELVNSGLAFLAFSMASSIGYIVNDINDIELDRNHPEKKRRPFASGEVSTRSGYLLVLSLGLLLPLTLVSLPATFNLILALYLINTFTYSKLLKNIPVLEMFSVAIGFVLRLVGGALVLNLAISEWFLIVGGFGALFVVTSKRIGERRYAENREVRKVVEAYTANFLSSCAAISVAISLTAYCFWAFSQELNPFWHQMSVIPFVMTLFRFLWLSERESIEAPEDVILGDWPLAVLLLSTMFSLIIAIY